ncbi:hypothetical protein [Marinobacter nauticus]|uniref:hypothetical protein n=1 Tax=Marinobacter nauticus TaxID=2743 RepID=UPI001CFE9BB8|nr:hypothetical protein [Marinobacter nauticus]
MSVRIDQTTRLIGEQRTFSVRYENGFEEQILVNYVGYLYERMWQEGRSSTWDHPIDDRKCLWRFRSYVERRAFAVHHTGRQMPLDEFREVWNITRTGSRGPERWYEVAYHRTCGDSMGAYENELVSQKAGLKSGFDEILKEDVPKAAGHLRSILGSTVIDVSVSANPQLASVDLQEEVIF